MINFTVSVDASAENTEYVRHLIKESLRPYATARVTFNQVETDWINRVGTEQEYRAWECGEIEL